MTAKSEAIERRQSKLADLIKSGVVEMTETSLIILDPDFPFEEYEDLGEALAGFHRSSCWWIGDWILHGEGTYGEKYAQAMTVTRLAEGTLMNYASVCRRVPRSRRRIGLPFSVHTEIASLSPQEQKHWLAVAERDDLKQRDVRLLLRPVKNGDRTTEQVDRDLTRGRISLRPNRDENVESLARSIVKQAVGDGNGRYSIPGELIIRLAAVLGEDGYEK